MLVQARSPAELKELIEGLRQRRDLLRPAEVQARAPEAFALGIPELDVLLGGGIPRGRVVALSPGPGGMATSIAVRLVAQLTAAGHLAAWCDRGDTFDPRGATRAGADLTRLLWCHPATRKLGAQAADALLASGAFPLVVLDLGGAPSNERGPLDSSWLRLARRAEVARASLVVLGAPEASPFASLTLKAEEGRPWFEGQGPGRTFEGIEVTLELVRNKLGLAPGRARAVLRVASLPSEAT